MNCERLCTHVSMRKRSSAQSLLMSSGARYHDAVMGLSELIASSEPEPTPQQAELVALQSSALDRLVCIMRDMTDYS